MITSTVAPRLRTTTAQYGIWVAQQVDPGSPGYLTAEAIELDGEFDTALLRSTAAELLRHCHALHMRFEWEDDTLWQLPQPPAAEVPLVDFTAEADPVQAADDWMRASLAVTCDVTTQPLFRSALLKTAPQRHAWFLQVHHIALDGFGYSLLQQAVAARYNALRAGLEPPTLPDWQLQGVIAAEVEYRANGDFEADRAFWREHLRRVPAAAQLAPAQESSDRPLRHTLILPPQQATTLQATARTAGCDWVAWMLSAAGLWLGRQSGQRDLCFGIPVMNRLGTPALGVPCMAMNIVPFSVHLRPEATLPENAQQAAAQLRAIKPHLFYRYGWIRGDLGLLQNDKFLFNQAVNLMPFDRHIAFTGLVSRMRPQSSGPVKDLNLTLVVEKGEWRLTLEANPQAYDAARLRELALDLHAQLNAQAQAPADTPLAAWMADMPAPSVCVGQALAPSSASVLDLLRAAAAAAPMQTALEWPNGHMSYGQLMAHVAVLAGQLARRGVVPGDTVAVLMPRSAEAIVAALAVLWVGGCYMPLDADGPHRRSNALLGAARPKLVLSQAPWHEIAAPWPLLCVNLPDMPDEVDATPLTCHAPQVQQPAYLLHTSGSTGTPKGVLVGHGALAHFVASTRDLYRILPVDRVLQFAPLHFDASLEEIFITLCHGATLVLRDDAMLDSVQTFAAEAERLGLTVLDLPTAYWHALTHGLDADAAHRLRRVRLVIVGGEAVLPERAAHWAKLLPAPELLNTYGPTETSIIASSAALAGAQAVWIPGEAVPIGRPRPGLTLRVADERLYPVPAGRSGELLISGPALALGYLDDEALTTRRFVTLPDSGERAYRSGDLAQWRDDGKGGQLRFLGRSDRELKISGLRIDPLEIENALLAVPEVQDAAVLPLRRAGDACTLQAFFVGNADPAALRAALMQSLPAPAVPDAWQRLPQLPRNANGKIDRTALLHSVQPAVSAEQGSPGASATEQAVMQAWRAVLGEMELAPESNFFDLGGKSLQAIQVTSRLAQAMQREVAVSLLFRHATVQALALALEAPAAYRPPGEQNSFAPLLSIQQAAEPGASVLFCLPPAEGLAWSYLRLARHLPRVTLHGLQLDPEQSCQARSFDALADGYLQRLLDLQPRGPYHLLGWSLGGALAQALAARLAACGETVALLALMDSYPAPAWVDWPQPVLDDALRTLLSVNGDFDTAGLDADALMQRLRHAGSPFVVLGAHGLERWASELLHQMLLFRHGSTPRFDGPMVFYRAQRNAAHQLRSEAWAPFVQAARSEYVTVDCSHDGMSDPRPMALIGTDLARRFKGG
ncbi:amino acid adenylation domain-containing protein [Verminephrobacter aporrectodeae subsp. tuberculatae]|uniref:amino acid adenylation domain-containing protein n=1 Tax=Verminephrobacter aporrectodeae TaxID=1110389 RepID=UPI002237B465|nr:amino acid adenylation domain-containing protein [Verminephrobacter aporrectodeae]MCW5256028.1 amino acid adenylation domain-containing protein [Verminephrobacter aporrectodeae subsp. tuberculatae]